MCVCALLNLPQTDGIRYLLYISPKPAVYLIDRKFDFYSVSNSFLSLVDVLAEEGTTLLDGEMITHLETKKLYFMVLTHTLHLRTRPTHYVNKHTHNSHNSQTRIHSKQHSSTSTYRWC